MATLIPAIGTSAFDSTGERRLAERLEQKLDADYLLWHNVPIGPKQTYPDFVVLNARPGLLVLEAKDSRASTTVLQIDRHTAPGIFLQVNDHKSQNLKGI